MKNSTMLKSRETIILNTHVWQKASPIVSILPFSPLIFFWSMLKLTTLIIESQCVSLIDQQFLSLIAL